jgi:hypothetical protein
VLIAGLNPMRMLLVEDDKNIVRFVKKGLSDYVENFLFPSEKQFKYFILGFIKGEVGLFFP